MGRRPGRPPQNKGRPYPPSAGSPSPYRFEAPSRVGGFQDHRHPVSGRPGDGNRPNVIKEPKFSQAGRRLHARHRMPA